MLIGFSKNVGKIVTAYFTTTLKQRLSKTKHVEPLVASVCDDIAHTLQKWTSNSISDPFIDE